MKIKLLSFLLLVSASVSFAQKAMGPPILFQYFDGADNDPYSSVIIDIDTGNPENIWQIGPPQKNIFDSAATFPNVLVTDTINTYPENNASSFYLNYNDNIWASNLNYGVVAFQWKQKLDMDTSTDGGIIEYSVDNGNSWINIFNNPYVYNFYGFDSLNVDTLNSGEWAFTGTDSVWRDIWLCFDGGYFWYNGSPVSIRFTFKSDSVDSNKEGWMIDNMLMHMTYLHGAINESEQPYLKVYPSTTTGVVHIETVKLQEYHIIEQIELISIDGKVMQTFGRAPTKFYIDISNHAAGMYYLKITTNKKTETFPVILSKNKGG